MFESLFVRTVAQCVEAGLVEGSKLHVDASLIDADAAKESVIKGAPELIALLKRAYRATESKLEETSTPGNYQAINDRMMSQSDPDAALVRKGGGDSRPRYQNHRVIDDHKGVITATETTPGSIAENKKLMDSSSTRAIPAALRKSWWPITSMAPVKTMSRVRRGGLPPTWAMRSAKPATLRNEPSLAMKILLMIRCATSTVVLSVKS